MKHICIFFIGFILIKLAYSENNECVKTRKWQIGYTMYENSWFDGKLHVYARCNDSSHFLPVRKYWNICENGKLKYGLPRCQPKSEIFLNCDVGYRWQDGITKYEVIRYGESLYVSAKCTKEDFIMDRDKSVILCHNSISNRNLPQCRKGEVKNFFEACGTGRRSRSDDYEFENEWHHGALNVRVFCIHDGTETRSDTILCENGKMKRSPTINFCKIQENNGDVCVLGKKWTVNDTEYEIKAIGPSFMVNGKCKVPGFHIFHSSNTLCVEGRIPKLLPRCKVVDLPSITIRPESKEVRTINGNSSQTTDKPISSTDRNKCRFENGGCNQICKYKNARVQCSCNEGYELQKDGKTCVVGNLPPRTISPVRKVEVHVTHRNSSHPAGKSPRPSENKCRFKNGGCNQICKTENETIQCSCSKGYELHKDNKMCVDINECLSNNFGCSDECINARGSAYCSCLDGFTLQSDGKHCMDIDECANNATNRCDHECHNTNGSHKCACRPGYVLINDFKCEVSQCTRLKPPENGDVHPPDCKDGLMSVNDKCYFTCNEGYSMKGKIAVFTCKNNLQWNYDEVPSCEPIRIPTHFTCPSDFVVNLFPDEISAVVYVKYPKTNVRDIHISPDWVEFERNISFPAGKTDIVLVANNPHFENLTVNCTFSVIVLGFFR